MAGIEQFNDEVFSAIKAHVEAHWTATPIKWPTGNFKKPDPPSAFVAVQMSGDVFDQETIGADAQANNRWDEEGTFWLHLTVPKNSDFAQVRGAAKALAVMFKGADLLEGRLEFLHAAIGPGGPADGEDGNWYVISVNVDWLVIDA